MRLLFFALLCQSIVIVCCGPRRPLGRRIEIVCRPHCRLREIRAVIPDSGANGIVSSVHLFADTRNVYEASMIGRDDSLTSREIAPNFFPAPKQ
jgi:hypothetical protein